MTELSYRTQIESMAPDGQLGLVVGRAITGNPDFEIEVICGARPLFIVRYLRVRLRIEFRKLSDRQAVVAVRTEHSLCKRTSSYGRGMWLAKLLRQSIYGSQEEMAHELGVTPPQVNRPLKIAELLPILLGAVASPHDILELWAVDLHKGWADERRRLLLERTRALEKYLPRPPAALVCETRLASRGQVLRCRRRGASQEVKSPTGVPLLRWERQGKDPALKIPNGVVEASLENALT